MWLCGALHMFNSINSYNNKKGEVGGGGGERQSLWPTKYQEVTIGLSNFIAFSVAMIWNIQIYFVIGEDTLYYLLHTTLWCLIYMYSMDLTFKTTVFHINVFTDEIMALFINWCHDLNVQ